MTPGTRSDRDAASAADQDLLSRHGLTVGGITALTTLFTALGPISMSMYAPAMPALARTLDTTVGMVQLTLTIYLIAFAVAQLVHGPLSDRFGRKPVLMAGLAIFVTGSLAAALAPSIGWLIAARFVQAIGVCAGAVIARAIVRDLFDGAAAARVMAAIGMALTIAPAIGPILGGYLTAWLDWRAIFVFHTLCGLLLAALTYRSLPETNVHKDPGALDPTRMAGNFATMLVTPQFVGFAVINACMLAGLFLFAAVGPFVFIDVLGVHTANYGWLTLLTTSAYFAGATIARRQSGRWGMRRMVLIGAGCSCLGCALLVGAVATGIVTVVSMITPMMMLTLGIGLSMPGAMAGALTPFPHIAGSASALLGFLQMGLGSVALVIAGIMGQNTVLALAAIPTGAMIIGLTVFLTMVPASADLEKSAS
ncbi:multidrug effflux MFS transporter [Fodinicurvata sp. EGI_FJ10296]|uniref:multidrug effflux MFS transporter n=1 Tax=Fodinicurvata sp. EGI_FJ10296 TaxID=3231908 RepID=UPI003456894D